MGYVVILLEGALGLCFVAHRCLANTPPSMMRSLARVSFRFSALAAALTVIGLVAGIVWANMAWGRLWGWEVRESASLGVTLWIVLFLGMHRWCVLEVRGVLLWSLAGNVWVILAWFGLPLILGGPGASSVVGLFVAAAVGLHATALLLGLAPLSWLPVAAGTGPGRRDAA